MKLRAKHILQPVAADYYSAIEILNLGQGLGPGGAYGKYRKPVLHQYIFYISGILLSGECHDHVGQMLTPWKLDTGISRTCTSTPLLPSP